MMNATDKTMKTIKETLLARDFPLFTITKPNMPRPMKRRAKMIRPAALPPSPPPYVTAANGKAMPSPRMITPQINPMIDQI